METGKFSGQAGMLQEQRRAHYEVALQLVEHGGIHEQPLCRLHIPDVIEPINDHDWTLIFLRIRMSVFVMDDTNQQVHGVEQALYLRILGVQ